ncbi:MAG: cytochrome B6 [Epsilonproteobacteria bacterium]|nr:MAG: cytochrome B6 [Campylobacterota bacterium]
MKQVVLILLLFLTTILMASSIRPLPQQLDDINIAKATLGKKLFSDTILSEDKTISCHSCHNFNYGGADPRKVSLGINMNAGNIQSPTVYNARYNFKQFWNGRANTLLDQADGPVHNPMEMGMDATVIEARLNKDIAYKRAFKAVYGSSKILYAQVLDAIVEFEMALVTPNAKFDRFLRGEISLSEQEMNGYIAFKKRGCITCHNGINIGSNAFQKMGLFHPYDFNVSYPDRYSVTHKEYDKNVFKVPTLRNIVLTAPYFHDASAKTLEEAIKTMAHHNLGVRMKQKDIDTIILFLKTLTGERPSILDKK